MSMVKNEDFKIIKGVSKLKRFINFIQKSPNIIFVQIRIYTHHHPRSNPAMTGFNVGCVDDIDTFELENVAINDGQNHPLDKK